MAVHGRCLGFSRASDQVYVLEPDQQEIPGQPKETFVSTYDVATGNVLHRQAIPVEKNWRVSGIHLLPNHDTYFIKYVYTDPATYKPQDDYDPAIVDARLGKYVLLDRNDLKTQVGPFPYSGSHWPQFSPDGKWLFSYQTSTGRTQQVIEVSTGKTVLLLTEQSNKRPVYRCCFSSDNKAVALWWYVPATKEQLVEVYDLPDMKLRFTQKLPQNVRELEYWENNRLYVYLNPARTGPQKDIIQCYSMEVGESQLGEPREEKLFEGFEKDVISKNGIRQYARYDGDILLQVSRGTPDTRSPWWKDWLAWLDAKWGTSMSESKSGVARLHIYDRKTGVLLHELKPLLEDWNFKMSPDHTRVADYQHDKLWMWDVTPASRWQWAWGLAVAGVLVMQLIKLFCSKRLVRRA